MYKELTKKSIGYKIKESSLEPLRSKILMRPIKNANSKNWGLRWVGRTERLPFHFTLVECGGSFFVYYHIHKAKCFISLKHCLVVTLEEYKKTLGSRLDGMTEQEIKNRMELQAKFARVTFDMWGKNLTKKTISINKIKEL